MKPWIATNFPKLLLLLTVQSFGIFGWSQQHDSTTRFTTEIYIEEYYGYDFGNPINQNRPEFLYTFDFPLKIRLEYRNFYNEREYFTWGPNPTAVNHYVGIHLITHF